jgi:hypothetical protein
MNNENAGVSWWRKVDWLKAVSEAVLTVAGPLGAPLKLLLEVRSDLKKRVNETVASVYEQSAEASAVAESLRSQDPNLQPLALKMVEFGVFSGSHIPLEETGGSSEEVSKRLQDLFARLRLRIEAPHFTSELRHSLAQYFWDSREIRMLLHDAQIELGEVDWGGTPEQIWFSVLERLRGTPPIRVLLLVYEAHKRKPEVQTFRAWLS